MTEPQKLQHRVAIAFNDTAAIAEEEAIDNLYLRIDHPGASMPHSLEPEPIELLDDEAPGGNGVLRYWLAGGGLVASALALSLGTVSGFTLFAICIGGVGIAAILYSFAERFERKPAETEMTVSPIQPAATSVEHGPDMSGTLMGSVHDALGDLTLCRSLQGIILSANQTFRDLTGCKQPEGRTCDQLGINFKVGKTEHCYDVEFKTASGTKTYLWHDIVTRDPLLNDFVVQSIARDVSTERLDVRRSEQARADAEADSGLKSRLIATVSHEIRTPLSGLLGMGHLLAGTNLSPEQRNYLNGISESGTALIQLVEDLLDFSMLADGRFQLKPRKETIRPLIESTVELLSSRAHAKGIEIGATISPELPETLIFDPARFRQVLYNVIGNAVKFTEQGGVIVSASLEGSALVVRVKDSGPGMEDAELQRIFGEFEQGDMSRAREGGVGLGLAISARIMAEAGGMLTVESRLGEGSTFLIRMPVAADAKAKRLGNELSNTNVLLFAPQGPAATALTTTLASLGAKTHTAANIAQAQALLSDQERFTDIIVDHRFDGEFSALLSQDLKLAGTRRVYLVNPESRPAQMSETDYTSWLIRPLREQSLIDVLTGRMKGLELRLEAKEFPLIAAEAADEQKQASASIDDTIEDAGLSILVGEDDAVNAMISQAILEKAGHRVRLAESFERLESALIAEHVDVVITDYSMPDGTCDSFISRLRYAEQSAKAQSLPIIVLTADPSDETRRKLLLSGADLVLVKPATPDMLKNAISHLDARLIRAA